MIVDDRARRLLADVLARRRDELVDRATDWVIGQAVDLKARRPRDETRRLVDRCTAAYEASLLHNDSAPMEAFIDFVTTFRASSEFRVSTLLRGVFSFRRALEDALRGEGSAEAGSFEVLAAADELYLQAAVTLSDSYQEKLVATILERRRELERDLSELTERRERELHDKLVVIEEQRATLAELSSPLIRVWKDVLVLPIIGAWGRERASEMAERALTTIRETSARVLLVDITGLTEVNEDALRHLPELARATTLIGSTCYVVGVKPSAARAIVEMDADLRHLRTFATLYDGLRAALAAGRREGATGKRGP